MILFSTEVILASSHQMGFASLVTEFFPSRIEFLDIIIAKSNCEQISVIKNDITSANHPSSRRSMSAICLPQTLELCILDDSVQC